MYVTDPFPCYYFKSLCCLIISLNSVCLYSADNAKHLLPLCLILLIFLYLCGVEYFLRQSYEVTLIRAAAALAV